MKAGRDAIHYVTPLLTALMVSVCHIMGGLLALPLTNRLSTGHTQTAFERKAHLADGGLFQLNALEDKPILPFFVFERV